jgi:hypothetical protein
MKQGAQLEESGVGVSMKVKLCSRKLLGVGVGRCETLIWLNTGSFGGFAKLRKYTFERHNRQEI